MRRACISLSMTYGETKGLFVATNRLLSSSRTVEAEWIEDRLAPFGSCVTAIVPSGFEAYVRLFHPAREWKRGHVRWADVAAKSGRTIHRLAQFHAIHRPQTGDPEHIEGPWSGKLPQDLLQAFTRPGRSPASSAFGKGTILDLPGQKSYEQQSRQRLASVFRTAIICCSRDRSKALKKSVTIFISHRRTCSGPRTAAGAWRPRSTCSARS